MRKYENAELEILETENSDILTASGNNDGPGGEVIDGDDD